MSTWNVYLRGVWVGTVEAADRAQALDAAMSDFDVDRERDVRLERIP